MAIVASGLTHTYMPGTPFQAIAIDRLDFTIQDGEMVGLIGHTGSGKSTLVQHLNGLLRPTAGTLTVQGIPIEPKGGDLRELRRRVGLVFQYPEHQLFEESVVKDVCFGPKNLGLSEDEAIARARQALRQVGLELEEVGERSPFELSGGQRRRVAMAGVLAMQPEVLILDEPAAGLDPASRREVMTLIRDIHEQQHCTVIMVSHSMEDVAANATRVMVMHEGRIVMDGEPKDVYARGEDLRAIGLDVPVVSSLADALRQRGLDVPKEVLSVADMEAFLCRQWGVKPHD